MNSLQTALQNVIGQYNYTLAPDRIGIASLDFQYITIAILVIMTIWFIYRMLLSMLVRRK